jgi:transcription termination factor Rho
VSDSTDILPNSGQGAAHTEPSDTGSARGVGTAETGDTVPTGAVASATPAPDGSGASEDAGTRPRRRGGLSGMVLAELQSLAASLGITGTGRMRKNELIAAIRERQGGNGSDAHPQQETLPDAGESAPAPQRQRRSASRPAGPPAAAAAAQEERPATVSTVDTSPSGDERDVQSANKQGRGARDQNADDAPAEGQSQRSGGERPGGERGERGDGGQGRDRRNQQRDRQRERGQENRQDGRQERQEGGEQAGGDRDDDFYDGNGGGRRRRGRFRDRRRGRERFGGETEPVIAEDDVLVPVAGILDVLDNYAFVRTSGYLTGPNDVYVSLSQVRRYGLRRGDAITGAVRQPREGERRDKYNALVRLDSVNGLEPDQAKNRPEFHKLTPLYPQERMRLETEPHLLTTRVIDLVMPIGKGQRALIVSPPKAGKTMVLQAIANAITTNNPECHLMVVLVDERPEEVTDMQRSVKGEVIASTFDRPPQDHTTVAELSIERAKRLVELGHDVVVLLDSITRLGRAYNLAAPASGRILSGGVDSTALYPPKRFLGAARNIENGGSLTIVATALVETGSTMDTVIFEEFKGTGNAELKLDRKIADKRVFPAVDVDQSSTRKEEILLGPDELAIVHKLRRVLHALESQQALDLLLDKLKQTRTNVEFLMQIQKTTVGPQD